MSSAESRVLLRGRLDACGAIVSHHSGLLLAEGRQGVSGEQHRECMGETLSDRLRRVHLALAFRIGRLQELRSDTPSGQQRRATRGAS